MSVICVVRGRGRGGYVMTIIRRTVEWVVFFAWMAIVFVQVEAIATYYGIWPAMLFGLILAPIGGILSQAVAPHPTEDR